MKKFVSIVLLVLTLALPAQSGDAHLSREHFNLLADKVEFVNSQPVRYMTYSEAYRKAVAEMTGVVVARNCDSATVQRHAREASIMGWQFCVVKSEDSRFNQGLTAYEYQAGVLRSVPVPSQAGWL